MKKKHKLDIINFLSLHRKFTNVQTWTKKKRENYEGLTNYLNNCYGEITINSGRDSKTTKVHLKNEFTFFRVPEKQTGKLMPYRGLMVMMICVNREKFNHFLKVYPVEINEENLENMIKREALKDYKFYLKKIKQGGKITY